MVLENQSPNRHNRMLGKLIKHPPSTNFNDDQDLPASKKLKRFESTDSQISCNSLGEIESTPHTPEAELNHIDLFQSGASSGEKGHDESVARSGHGTELESVLPAIKSDKEAIAEYEASRAAGDVEDLNLQQRLGLRKWVKGRSSIYVDAFNLALETVLEEEKHLFNDAELGVFDHWQNLPYEAQYL